MQENGAWVTYASKIQSGVIYHHLSIQKDWIILFSQGCDPAK